jgi:uncharacterized protein
MAHDALVANCLLFARVLRAAGIPVGLDRAQAFVQALEWIDIGDRAQVFHTARSLLVSRQEHLRLFEIIFGRFWRLHAGERLGPRARMPLAPRHLKRTTPFVIAAYMAARADASDPERDMIDRSGSASALDLLQRKSFAALNAEELEQVRRLIQQMSWRLSLRRTRRRELHRRGPQLHLRAIVRDAARHGGAALRLTRQRRRSRQRPLVVLCDISGSMEKYARLLLQFLYCLGASMPRVESFVFGTRLTRITPQLRLRNIDRAIDEAAREVADWAGGTQIGASLHRFNRRWSRRVLGRGAVVLIVSDGWERGDPQLLASELRFIRHRCHRLIWLNPLLGRAGYQPLVAGMRAAHANVDELLPIDDMRSLHALAARLSMLDGRRSER